MATNNEPSVSELRSIPLLHNIPDEHLHQLLALFERREHKAGELLFRTGDRPTDLLLLVTGQVHLLENEQVRFRLLPIAPIGELGALTGLYRRTTAVVSEPSQVWRVAATTLLAFFQSNAQVALRFYQNLLDIVASKARKDARRIDEMRSNLVRTQKTMKAMRDLLLEAPETPVSMQLHDSLASLIEQNRRSHYMVEPADSLRAFVRFDDRSVVDVTGISDGWVSLRMNQPTEREPGSQISAVLMLPNAEFPISGSVDQVDDNGMVIALDLLIDEYRSLLEDYLTRVQMLEFVV